jgi:hypothetical protein
LKKAPAYYNAGVVNIKSEVLGFGSRFTLQPGQIFNPKIPIWVNFVESGNEKMLVYYLAIVTILWQFGIVFGHLVYL